MKGVKLAIVGSVRLAGNAVALRIIENVIRRHQPTMIVSGGADGIDSMAIAAAKRHRLPFKEFKPRARRWDGRGGYKERNLKIAQFCDELVRIVSSKSHTYGSGWTRDQARKLGKPTEEFTVKEA